MRRRDKDHLLTSILLGILSLALASGQEKKRVPTQHPLQYDAAAVVKLVTVRVLNQDGRPMTNLEKEDFVLYDNGELKTITEFEVHTLSEKGMKVLSPGRVSPLAEAAKGMNRRLFIFLDIQGSGSQGMVLAKKAALHFIDTQLRPGDEVGVIGFSPMRGFLIQEYLTTDHKKIRRAVEKTKEIPPSGGSLSGGELDDRVDVPSSPAQGGQQREGGQQQGGESKAEVMGFLGESQVVYVPGTSAFQRRDFVPRMSDLAEALKYVPGNKSLVLFSGRNLGPDAVKLGKEFASSSTPVYTVNTQNWIEKGVLSSSVKEKYIWTEHPLKELALASGGQYFADVKDVETIARDVQALTGNFYVLGYYVSESWDGKYHQVRVEVKRPGLQVLAQDGYFNPKPYAELTDFEKQLQLSDLLFTEKPATLDPLDIPVEPLILPGQKAANCALLARMMVNEKTGVPPVNVDIYSYIFNEDRKVVMAKQGEINLRPYDQKTLYPCLMTRLPAGEYEYRIVALDRQTGQAALGKIVFVLPEKMGSDIVLSSPLLFAEGQESPIIKISDKRSKKTPEEDVSLNDVYKYIPKKHGLVVRDVAPDTRTLLAVLPVTTSEGPAPEVEFNIWLYPQPEGEAIVLETEIIDLRKASEDTDILILAIRLPKLDPGEYEMEIEAQKKDISASSSIRKWLIMK